MQCLNDPSAVNDSNVQFMEKSKDSSQRGLHMALPFTRGQAFIVSVLDAILSLVNTAAILGREKLA